MALKPLPTHRIERIAVGTSIRKPPDVLKLWMKHLDAQVLPPNVELVPYVALDTDDKDAARLVTTWAELHGGYVTHSQDVAKDFEDNHPITHQWTVSAFRRVAELKNRLIRQAMDDGCTAFWFCDADLLCDPMTLSSLYNVRAPIVSAVYWTRWDANAPEPLPQVWLNHPYGLEGHGLDWPTFRNKLLQREVCQVWGQGACTLIQEDVFRKGVDFTPVEGLPQTGMWQGEDRAFCLRAEQAHLPMFADPWPDIFHIYHPTDRGEAAEKWSAALLEPTPPLTAGDMVSVHLHPLEPIEGQRLAPFLWRGRIGFGHLTEDLDRLILTLKRGETAIEAIRFPQGYPEPSLRNQKRIMHVTLLDHRPFVLPPNLGGDDGAARV